MAGNYRSGRKPNDSPQKLDPLDVPHKPETLSDDASAFWDEFISPAKHLRKADSAMAQMCAEMWDLYRKSERVAKNDPLHKDTRIAVNQYCATWKTLMERLALDPLGRVRAGKSIERPKDEKLREFGIVS